jgi:hypothetical protein
MRSIHLAQTAAEGRVLTGVQGVGEDTLAEVKAAASWTSLVDDVRLTTLYYDNVRVDRIGTFLNDENNQPIHVIEAFYTFLDVAWFYDENGPLITDFCGEREFSDERWAAAFAFKYQLVPQLGALYYINNGCLNPFRVFNPGGGRLTVIVNDLRRAFDDNRGSFDVKVDVVRFIPEQGRER